MNNSRRDQEVEDGYQVDAVVALFSILLVILIALASANLSRDGESNLAYAPKENETELFLLESIQTPYRFREIWLLDATALYRIDLMEIAARLLTEAGDAQSPINEDGLSVVAQFDLNAAPSNYRLTISRTSVLTQGTLIDRVVDHYDTEARKSWASEEKQIIIFVSRDAWDVLPTITNELRRAKAPFRTVPLATSDANIELSRSRFNFEQNMIMRSY